jgi:hypothetical protein
MQAIHAAPKEIRKLFTDKFIIEKNFIIFALLNLLSYGLVGLRSYANG